MDASSVHPESYDVARKIVAACGRDIRQIMGDGAALKSLRAEEFVAAMSVCPLCGISLRNWKSRAVTRVRRL